MSNYISGLSFGGLASGIDSKTLIAQLVALRRRPIALIEQRVSKFQEKKSLFGQLKTKLEELYNATEPTAREEDKTIEPEEKDIPIEADTSIDTTQIEEMINEGIAKALSAEKIQSAIKEGVNIAVKIMRGKVE